MLAYIDLRLGFLLLKVISNNLGASEIKEGNVSPTFLTVQSGISVNLSYECTALV